VETEKGRQALTETEWLQYLDLEKTLLFIRDKEPIRGRGQEL
jgi:hypothetical protein